MSLFDLISTIDETGRCHFSLTEMAALALFASPTVMAWYLLLSGADWAHFPEYCFYSIGGAVSAKATKGGVGAVTSYYQGRQYQGNQGGKTF
ncbi:MAG: hypothetical protein LBO03_04555 [Acidaminococcales bacterium]|nr:hypothetical protein [Acidaminococcales bacterium]